MDIGDTRDVKVSRIQLLWVANLAICSLYSGQLLSTTTLILKEVHHLVNPLHLRPTSSWAQAFEHLVLSWWHCLGRLWNLQEVEPSWRKYVSGGRLWEFIALATLLSWRWTALLPDPAAWCHASPTIPDSWLWTTKPKQVPFWRMLWVTVFYHRTEK